MAEGFIKTTTIGQEEIFRIGAKSRIFKFDYTANQFQEDSTVATRFGLQKDGVFPITGEDAWGNILFKTVRKGKNKQELILVSRSGSNSFERKRFDISRIFENVNVNTFLEENVIWNMGPEGIVRHVINEPLKTDTVFNTHLNKIILLGDSVFFQGIRGAEQNVSFPYATNSFRFEFAATNFTAGESNEFQYKLEGYDDAWSAWTTENVKEYSRLWEGRYNFLVRGRNYAEQIGTPDEFAFIVAPPWYRTLYAYATYS